MGRSNNWLNTIKWLVLIATYAFLIYKLANINYWMELRNAFAVFSLQRLVSLLLVILLMPINWTLEIFKWQFLVRDTSPLPFPAALKSVLAGLNTGYITPNRIGEFAGRILFLPKKSQIAGVALSVVNSLTQNLVMMAFGIFGSAFYFANFNPEARIANYIIVISVLLLVCIVVCLVFPTVIKKGLPKRKWSLKLFESIRSLEKFTPKKLIIVLGISSLRYVIFCLQLFLILNFFDIAITPLQALVAIPAFYLLVTFTPSFAASEPAIRGSVAVIVFGTFSQNEVGILLSGILIWLINFVIPMLIGTFIVGSTQINRE